MNGQRKLENQGKLYDKINVIEDLKFKKTANRVTTIDSHLHTDHNNRSKKALNWSSVH